jgi:2-amino-4-hydroxy-6-hydroxymethyldihydropteridine diphosphokinase
MKVMPSAQKPSVAYVGMGSNLGDRKRNLREGLKAIEASDDINLIKVSSLYLTRPIEVSGSQNDYLNAVVKIETTLTPESLLDSLKEIEQRLGRKVDSHLEPRSLDLDILLYDYLVMETESLTLPHPRLTGREFVLAPLLEVESELENPIDGVKLSVYYEKLKGSQGASLFEDDTWWRG